jgi:hypothetical protein
MTFVAGGALKPIGGHILSHSSATRMFLRKGKLSEMLKERGLRQVSRDRLSTSEAPNEDRMPTVSHY